MNTGGDLVDLVVFAIASNRHFDRDLERISFYNSKRSETEPYFLEAGKENGENVSVGGDGFVEFLGLNESALEGHRGFVGSMFQSVKVLGIAQKGSELIVAFGALQSKLGEGLEWQRDWAGTSNDKSGRERVNFILRRD